MPPLNKPTKPVTYGNQKMITRSVIEERDFTIDPIQETDEQFVEELPLTEFLYRIGIENYDRLESYSLILSVDFEDEIDIVRVRTVEYLEESDAEVLHRVDRENKALKRYNEDYSAYQEQMAGKKSRIAQIQSMQD